MKLIPVLLVLLALGCSKPAEPEAAPAPTSTPAATPSATGQTPPPAAAPGVEMSTQSAGGEAIKPNEVGPQ